MAFGYGSRRNTINSANNTGIPVPGSAGKGTGIPRRSIGSRRSGVNGTSSIAVGVTTPRKGAEEALVTPPLSVRRKKIAGVGEG